MRQSQLPLRPETGEVCFELVHGDCINGMSRLEKSSVDCIKLHGNPAVRTMLDPFLGIGHSALAAKQCGMSRFIGFEIDEVYLAEARRQLSAGG